MSWFYAAGWKGLRVLSENAGSISFDFCKLCKGATEKGGRIAVAGIFRTGCSEKEFPNEFPGLTGRELAIFAFWFGFAGFSERGVRMKRCGKAGKTLKLEAELPRSNLKAGISREQAEPGTAGARNTCFPPCAVRRHSACGFVGVESRSGTSTEPRRRHLSETAG